MKRLKLHSDSRSHFINITSLLQKLVEEEGAEEGLLHVFVPHTTAGITINEGADPSVIKDMEDVLDGLVPWNGPYRHREGNTAAHVKSSLMGSSIEIMIQGGELCLGTWQAVFFCEFDGPRNRNIFATIIG